MQILEPRCLPKIRSLPANLEREPLITQMSLFQTLGPITQHVISVVLLDDVLQNGAGFPEHKTRIRIFDRGGATVGVELDERFFLDKCVVE
jgi:hypothetical protein